MKRSAVRAHQRMRAIVQGWRQGATEFSKVRIGFFVRQAPVAFLLIGFVVVHPSLSNAASAISLAGVDYYKLCRDTAHVPLVQAAIDPAHINVWSEPESRRAGRYEQYSFKTQRIDVRVEHDVSLYHGLIHRTLDLIGESQWKHRDFAPQEDQEHWLIYHTLELYWPGLQRVQGGEPSVAMLAFAGQYWRQYAARYAEIAAKAATLAELSWCALNMPMLEAMQMRSPAPARQQAFVVRAVPPPAAEPVPEPVSVARVSEAVASPAVAAAAEMAALPPAAPPSLEAIEPQPQPRSQSQPTAPQPAAQTRVQQQSQPLKQPLPERLAMEPIWVMSEFLSISPVAPAQRPSSDALWATSADQSAPPVPQSVVPQQVVEPASQQPAAPWTPAQSIWATPAERAAAADAQPQASTAPRRK